MSMAAETRTPSYRLHKASGQAIVTLDGYMVYLGRFDSPESREKYERVIGEWKARGALPSSARSARRTLSVDDLIAGYWKHAELYYRKEGQPTGELACIRQAMRFLHRAYGSTAAEDFGPLALKACRAGMIVAGLCRTTINGAVGRIKRCFRWAVENEALPATVYEGLRAVPGLKRGRSEARDNAPVRPVTEADMRAVLPHVARQVAAMIELQWLTGMRPGEVVQMRTGDLDRSGDVWTYQPRRHKVEHHGIERGIPIGPQGLRLLRPFLKLDPEAPLFSPREAERERNRSRRKRRITKRWPSHARRRSGRSRRDLQEAYDTASYRRAVARGCEQAGIQAWSPNQLRHAAATRIRAELGLEAASAVLGHRLVETTQIYAEVSARRARDVMQRMG
ncbi:MAG: site-specific integrase [Planctomycetota bacterium]